MCKGPLRRFCHWGPLTAIAIIKIVSFVTIHCNGLWWPPDQSLGGTLNAALFLLFSASTLYNFLNAMFMGPGHVPLGWHPSDRNDYEALQWCGTCKGYKAPRAHHCKKCGQCVLKMDHHCPWINGCVGHTNHASFILFLFFAVCGCFQATIVIACTLYYALYRNWYLYHGSGTEPYISMNFYVFGISVFALGLAIGVVLAVGMLLVCQLKSIIKNRTTIEDWIISKAEFRRKLAESKGEFLKPFVYPYDLGAWNNFCQVLNSSFQPVGDGITWPVVSGCDQYTLTREQIAQKTVKKERTRLFVTEKAYSGRIFPVVHGLKVLCSPPCSDEARMPLSVGDYVLATRYLKHWLFGEKVTWESISDSAIGHKGWFPRCCVTQVEGNVAEKMAEIKAKKHDKKTI